MAVGWIRHDSEPWFFSFPRKIDGVSSRYGG